METSITDPSTGVVVSHKLTLGEPTPEQRENGCVTADELLRDINLVLEETRIVIWFVLDRLDVAFSDSPELERNALRSLFRGYLDLTGYSNISVKIFLRDDIWRKLSEGGFREASHITRSLTISWDQPALLNLVVRRLIHNDAIREYYFVEREAVLGNIELQSEFFYTIFPRKVAIGQKQPSSLDWMLSRTADGSRRNTPRELIHLLTEIRDQQLRLYELGNAEPAAENLIDRLAIRQALAAVSKVRYEQTLCAENPTLKRYLDQLEGEKTQQNPGSLSGLWKCSPEKAIEIADQLVEVGFFERKGTKDNPTYGVPFLYRGALRLVQGTA